MEFNTNHLSFLKYFVYYILLSSDITFSSCYRAFIADTSDFTSTEPSIIKLPQLLQNKLEEPSSSYEINYSKNYTEMCDAYSDFNSDSKNFLSSSSQALALMQLFQEEEAIVERNNAN